MSKNDIGKFIKSLRKKRGFTITKLAELSNVSHSYISQIENGKFKPSPDILLKLSGPLGVSYEELMIKAGYLLDNKSEIDTDIFILVPLIHDVLNEMYEENPHARAEILKFKDSLNNFLNDKIPIDNLKRQLYDLEPDNELIPRLGSWEKTAKLEDLLNLLYRAVKENKFFLSLLDLDIDKIEKMFDELPTSIGIIEELAVNHFSELKNVLLNDYEPLLLKTKPIITFNGHPLTIEDRMRIFKMIELMFPEYSGHDDDNDDNNDDNDSE